MAIPQSLTRFPVSRQTPSKQTQDFSYCQLTIYSINFPYAREKLKMFLMQKRIGKICSQDNDMSIMLELCGTEVNSLFEQPNPEKKCSIIGLTDADMLRITVTPLNQANTHTNAVPDNGVMIVTSYASTRKIENEREPAAFAVRGLAYMIANLLYALKKSDMARMSEMVHRR